MFKQPPHPKYTRTWTAQDLPTGPTPRENIWKKNKATLWYYSTPEKKDKTPLFLIYSLINQANILDLGSGYSMIEGFLEQGYDVYLLDFGKPGYEDKHLDLGYYIYDYIEKAARRIRRHSGANDLTVIGYCLGGTLAVIHAALTIEPIKNLVLLAPPIDFSELPYMKNLHESLKSGDLVIDELIELYGIIPAKGMEVLLRLITAPVNLSPYLGILGRRKDDRLIERWKKFNQWVKGHVPFAGAAMKDLVNEMLVENKLIKNELILRGKNVDLGAIKANLLVVSTKGDQLIPEEMTKPLMSQVGSKDKTYMRVRGGHVTLAIKGGIPDFLAEWLAERS